MALVAAGCVRNFSLRLFIEKFRDEILGLEDRSEVEKKAFVADTADDWRDWQSEIFARWDRLQVYRARW